MPAKGYQYYIKSAGCLLLVFGVAKWISAFGHSKILTEPNPLFGLQFRYVLILTAMIELIVAMICFFGAHRFSQLLSLALLSTNILGYRIFLLLIGAEAPCPCLGGLTDAIGVSPHAADVLSKVVLAYLLVGSYFLLLCIIRSRTSFLKRSSQRP